MEDHHVDRPGVEVRQRMKLTGTNSSFGLITLILDARENGAVGEDQFLRRTIAPRASFARSALRWLGGNCEGPEPDPIPNSAVKLLRANDTSS